MQKNSKLIFGNTNSIQYSNIQDWKIQTNNVYQDKLEVDSKSSPSDFLCKCSYQVIGDIFLYTSIYSSFLMSVKKDNNHIVDFIIPIHGKVTFKTRQKTYNISGGHSLLLNKELQHCENIYEPGEVLCISTTASSLNRVMNATQGFSAEQYHHTHAFGERIIDINETNIGFQLALIKALKIIDILDGDTKHLCNIGLDDVIYRIVINLVNDTGYNSDNKNIRNSNRSDRSVDILCDKIRQFPGHVMTLTEMQETTGLSGRSLQLAFNRRFGCTAREWQRNEHLDRARQLLTDGNNNQSIKQISYATGFSSLASFSRFYLARFGELPSVTQQRKK